MCAWCYEPGIQTIQFYMKSPLNPYKTYWNAIIIAQNTNANITP